MDAAQIIRVYDRRTKDLSIEYIRNYADAQEYARDTGKEAASILSNPVYVDLEAIDEDEAVSIFSAVMRRNYDDIVKACRAAQGSINRRAQIGLGILDAGFDLEGVREIVRTIVDAKEFTPDFVKNLIINQSNKVVDRTISTNAGAQSSAGLAVHITRRYDDVGLHGGKDPCQWCLKRAGEWTDYWDAYNAGCFERHPGCGCVIEYNVGKTHTWSNTKGTWNDL